MKPIADEYILKLTPYIPGRPPKETSKEFGLGRMIKLASNENCFGPSPLAVEAIKKAVHDMHLYPNDGRLEFKEKVCDKYSNFSLNPNQIVFGNGSNELITLLVRAFVGQGEAMVTPWPVFICYSLACRAQNRQEIRVNNLKNHKYDLDSLAEQVNQNKKSKLIFLANPNNPTGRYITKAELENFVSQIPDDKILVLDEAYTDYVKAEDYPDGLEWVQKRPRTVALRTFSKSYGLAGQRIGFAICDPEIARILHAIRDPFNINGLGAVGAQVALADDAHIEKACVNNIEELPKLKSNLENLEFEVAPSVANFVMATKPNMPEIINNLLKKGVIIRPIANYDLPDSARITVGTPEENAYLLTALQEIL